MRPCSCPDFRINQVYSTQDGQVYATFALGSGSLVARYVTGEKLECRIAASGAPMFYHVGPVSHITETTDANGHIANPYRYLPFGQELSKTETIANPFRFNGAHGVYDDESGLLYMRARFYDKQLGRFMQRDPIGMEGGLPLYGFVAQRSPSARFRSFVAQMRICWCVSDRATRLSLGFSVGLEIFVAVGGGFDGFARETFFVAEDMDAEAEVVEDD